MAGTSRMIRLPVGSWQQAQRVPRLRCNCGRAEWEREGRAVVVVRPLVAEVRTEGVAAFAENNVLSGAVDVAPVHGEALRGAKVATNLFHGGRVATEGLRAGACDAPDQGQELSERMLNVDHMPTAIGPLAQIGGGFGLLPAPAECLGPQCIPIPGSGREA